MFQSDEMRMKEELGGGVGRKGEEEEQEEEFGSLRQQHFHICAGVIPNGFQQCCSCFFQTF